MKLAIATFALALCVSPALADCKTVDPNKTSGISKDGTHAPLEAPDSTAEGKTAQKDGSTMPLATQEAGGNKDLATSQQDVEAQQQGDKTAAAKAAEDCKVDGG